MRQSIIVFGLLFTALLGAASVITHDATLFGLAFAAAAVTSFTIARALEASEQ